MVEIYHVYYSSAMPTTENDIFAVIQRKDNIKIPKCLIEILRKSGYDSILSFTNMNASAIKEIEVYIEKKR